MQWIRKSPILHGLLAIVAWGLLPGVWLSAVPVAAADEPQSDSATATAADDNGSIVRCDSGNADSGEPLWVKRCYNGSVTLANYDSLESIGRRLKSQIASKLIQEVAGFQKPDFSGQLVSGDQIALLTVFLMSGGHLGWAHDVAPLTEDIRQTGPVFETIGFDTHQRVRLFYSDEVVDWLKRDRQGAIPDGAMIVKQMYASNPQDSTYGADRVSGWAVMVRNSNASKDGWIWYLFFFPRSPPYGAPLPVVYSQTGDSFCLSCHAAADNDQMTYASINNLKGAPQAYSWIDTVYPGLLKSPPDKTQTKTKAPTSDELLRKVLGGGVAQFQRLGHLTESQQVSRHLTTFNLTDLRTALDRLKSLDRNQKAGFLLKLLDADLQKLDTKIAKDLATAGQSQYVLLLEELVLDLEKAIADRSLNEFLTSAMEIYARALMQVQTHSSLPDADPSILQAYGPNAKASLPASQTDINWFALDYLFSHTPALPKELPQKICDLMQVKQSNDKPGVLKDLEEDAEDLLGKVSDCRSTFITSDNCNGCHWNYVLQGESLPLMLTADTNTPPNSFTDSKFWDISPYSEWSASPMGLAGRDPIFHAQLSWEQEREPRLAAKISNLCLRCHQAGAQRQYHLDHGDTKDPAIITPPGTGDDLPLFTADYFNLPPSSHINNATKWGALGRDGITCTVCHQIEAKGLGQKESFTGQFSFPSKPGPLYGPYADDEIEPYLMEQAIGMTPAHAKHITSSALCGSCHTVITPVLTDHLEAFTRSGGRYRTTYEQTTYPEWVNSSYSAEGGQSCQQCHMATRLPDSPLDSLRKSSQIIANVESAYLPDLDNRAADKKITPTAKHDYPRHTLVGMNLFMNQMFQQFPLLLGNSARNAGGMPTAHAPLVLAEKEMKTLAREGSVDLAISPATSDIPDHMYGFDVLVTNKVGHKFPSGVGFRRAFLHFEALDESGKVLWASGRTNSVGQIVGADLQVIENEMTRDPLKIESGKPLITSQDHVYIFEERTATWKHGDPNQALSDGIDLSKMQLSTSFLEIVTEVKDTRLLPKGWSRTGQFADVTHLSVVDEQRKETVPFYPPVPGQRSIRYQVDRSVGKVSEVRVTMCYQSIPPYYIRDRLEYDTKETQRFYYLISHLNTKDTPIENWTVQMVTHSLKLK
jgi:hypothetical protein